MSNPERMDRLLDNLVDLGSVRFFLNTHSNTLNESANTALDIHDAFIEEVKDKIKSISQSHIEIKAVYFEPGITMLKLMAENGFSTRELSLATRLNENHIQGLIDGSIKFDKVAARLMAEHLGESIDFWMRFGD